MQKKTNVKDVKNENDFVTSHRSWYTSNLQKP